MMVSDYYIQIWCFKLWCMSRKT